MRSKILMLTSCLMICSGLLHGQVDDIFNLQTNELDELQSFMQRGQGLIFDIKNKTDTLKIGILAENIVNGVITLGSTGSYIFNDNLTCDIAITGTNVTLDLAGKSLIGTINVTGSVTIIKNGAIVAPPPYFPAMAAVPALTLSSAN